VVFKVGGGLNRVRLGYLQRQPCLVHGRKPLSNVLQERQTNDRPHNDRKDLCSIPKMRRQEPNGHRKAEQNARKASGKNAGRKADYKGKCQYK